VTPPAPGAGLVIVALAAARAVHDDLGSLRRGLDPVALGQVAGHELDALAALVAVPAEHADVVPQVPQPRDDQSPQGAGTTGHEEG
jgi:hypothetical protein